MVDKQPKQDKYTPLINFIKNLTGIGLIVFIIVMNVAFGKNIDYITLFPIAVLMGVDVEQFIKK